MRRTRKGAGEPKRSQLVYRRQPLPYRIMGGLLVTRPENRAIVRACASSSFTVAFPEYGDTIIEGQLACAKFHMSVITRAFRAVPVDEIGHALASQDL